MLIFALLNAVLVEITRYPTVCLICARKRSRISAKIYIDTNFRKVKRQPPACAIYNASPEMKRAAYHASYRVDPEEKRVASRVPVAYDHVFLYLKPTFARAACSGLLVYPDS